MNPVRMQVQSVIRNASAGIAGAPGCHVLHNPVAQRDGACAGVSPERHTALPAFRMRDFWGYGCVTGTVSIEGAPAVRKVRLFDGLTGLLIAQTWSGRDGSYRFDYLDPSRDYFVLSHDYVRQFNAVIADWVKPEAGCYP